MAAFACDILGTILVIADVVISRKNKDRLSAVQNHITNLEVITHKTKQTPPAKPGEMIEGMDVAEILQIMQGATEEATIKSKEVMLGITKEIERSERIPLTLIASFVLFAGILLHALAEGSSD